VGVLWKMNYCVYLCHQEVIIVEVGVLWLYKYKIKKIKNLNKKFKLFFIGLEFLCMNIERKENEDPKFKVIYKE